jgi:hypothetical protein
MWPHAALRAVPGAILRICARGPIRHHAEEGFHRGSVSVSLPPKGMPRDRWLTRSEAARLLWACWSTRETQRAIPTVKFPLRHIARFILIVSFFLDPNLRLQTKRGLSRFLVID